MPINYALFSGVSGLSTNADGMAVIANNIANANTRAFKTDRAEFEDLLAVSLNENSLLGRGSKLRNIQTSFSQGALTNTGGLTDLSVQGDGFFVIKNDLAEVKDSMNSLFTRQGSFRFDKDGKVTDPSGGRLQGYMMDKDGSFSTKIGDVQIISNNIPPKSTNVVNMVLNLDVREKPPYEAFDVMRPKQTSNFAGSVTIYDNFGASRQADLYFRRMSDTSVNAWEWFAMVDGKEIDTVSMQGNEEKSEPDENGNFKPVIINKGIVEFDDKGYPKLTWKDRGGNPAQIDVAGMTDASEIKFKNGASPQKLQFNFGPGIDFNGKTNSSQSSSSIAANSILSFHSQDGYESGNLKSLKIENDGIIRGIYTNGLERELAAIALATFPNNHGLQKIGRNNFVASPKAGEPRIGHAQTGTRGSIYSATLEESNVDLAQQFVDMITTQRGFQANSKSITTTDTLLEEIISLKR